MNDNNFYQCRVFLEQQINAAPENIELIKAYVRLIEKKTEFDIAYFSQNADVQKNWNDNEKDMNKTWQTNQAEITKIHLEKGQPCLGF